MIRNQLLLDTETSCYLRQIKTIWLPFNVCDYLTGLLYGDDVAIAVFQFCVAFEQTRKLDQTTVGSFPSFSRGVLKTRALSGLYSQTVLQSNSLSPKESLNESWGTEQGHKKIKASWNSFACCILERVKPNAADRVGAICIYNFQFLLVT